MSLETWTLLIAVVTAATCGLCGSLLLLGRQAMVSEGLSHAVLPGIVIAFMVTRSFESPWLIVAAAVSGLIMVLITRMLASTRLVETDAGLGIVFSAMFSFGVLLVSMYLRNAHFHADCVVDGNLALASLDRVEVPGFGRVPKSLIAMLLTLAAVTAFLLIAFKEVKAMVFDSTHASCVGLRPALFGYVWIALVSLTTVVAFDAAGSVLIVALMIAPAASAYLLTKRYVPFLCLSVMMAAVCAVVGFYVARAMDVSPTGPIASVSGGAFLLAFVFNPTGGLIGQWVADRRQKAHVTCCLTAELVDGCDVKEEAVARLHAQLGLSPRLAQRAIQDVIARNWLQHDQSNDSIHLTSAGHDAIDLKVGSPRVRDHCR
ncbi:MAG: metal ABC transporter permease [Planctomycetota bacterium]